MTLLVHTKDRKRYMVQDRFSSAHAVMKAIEEGRAISCGSGLGDSYDVVFNPDNVVSVTES